MPEENAVKPALTLEDQIQALIPAPGLYIVGEFRGIEQITSAGKQHNFVKVITDSAMIQAYLPAENLMEYVKKEEGETVLVPVDVNVRKNKLSGAVMDQVQFGVRRSKK